MTRNATLLPKTVLTGLAVAFALGAMVPDAAAKGGRDPGDIADQKRVFEQARKRNAERGESGGGSFSRLLGGDDMKVDEAAKGGNKAAQ